MNNTTLQSLEIGVAYSFGDWPNQSVSRVAIGAYTVWENDRFLYVSSAGENLTMHRVIELREHSNQRRGLYERLASHAYGRRGGDQFCLYVCDRLVLPSLTAQEIAQIARGDLLLDDLTRRYVRELLTYRFIEVDEISTARRIEKAITSGALTVGRPFLNPS